MDRRRPLRERNVEKLVRSTRQLRPRKELVPFILELPLDGNATQKPTRRRSEHDKLTEVL